MSTQTWQLQNGRDVRVNVMDVRFWHCPGCGTTVTSYGTTRADRKRVLHWHGYDGRTGWAGECTYSRTLIPHCDRRDHVDTCVCGEVDHVNG